MNIVLDEMKLPKNRTMVIQTNALNERNYGELQALDKTETSVLKKQDIFEYVDN